MPRVRRAMCGQAENSEDTWRDCGPNKQTRTLFSLPHTDTSRTTHVHMCDDDEEAPRNLTLPRIAPTHDIEREYGSICFIFDVAFGWRPPRATTTSSATPATPATSTTSVDLLTCVRARADVQIFPQRCEHGRRAVFFLPDVIVVVL